MSRNREIDQSIREAILYRSYDDWALTIFGRLESVNELHAEDAVYHKSCYSNFKTGKQLPGAHTSSKNNRKRSRPKDILLDEAYAKVCALLMEKEANDEQVTVTELAKFMDNLVSHTEKEEGYSVVYLKKRITEDFKDQVVIGSMDGKADVVTFVSTASKVLLDFNNNQTVGENTEVEKMRLIKAASDIIRNEIKSLESNTLFYPTTAQIESSHIDFVPPTLACFLGNLFSCKDTELIKSSIAQAIIQHVRPRSILSPMQLSLAVMLHRHFGSRYLIDTLNKMGFCSSYSEVQRFINCSAEQHGVNLYE